MRAISAEIAVLAARAPGATATLSLPIRRGSLATLAGRQERAERQKPGIWIIESSPALVEKAVLLLLIAASFIGIGSCFLSSTEAPQTSALPLHTLSQLP